MKPVDRIALAAFAGAFTGIAAAILAALAYARREPRTHTPPPQIIHDPADGHGGGGGRH